MKGSFQVFKDRIYSLGESSQQAAKQIIDWAGRKVSISEQPEYNKIADGLVEEAEACVQRIDTLKKEVTKMSGSGNLSKKQLEVISSELSEATSLQATLEKIQRFTTMAPPKKLSEAEIALLVKDVPSSVEQYELVSAIDSLIAGKMPQDFIKKLAALRPETRLELVNRLVSLHKFLEGKVSECSVEEIKLFLRELEGFKKPFILELFDLSKIAQEALESLQTAGGTRAHEILHDFATLELSKGNEKSALSLVKLATESFPLTESHPLYDMDTAIREGQKNPNEGVYFGSLDSSVLKGGHLHATQRIIDGKLINSFDFKISYYACDEQGEYLRALDKYSNPAEITALFSQGLCTGCKIDDDAKQKFIRYDEGANTFTKNLAYVAGEAVEITFVGVGKITIGADEEIGTLYNWIQVEMEANQPPGEGLKKLQQMLALCGLGPVLGQQPEEADERMKIAQLLRAYYPATATKFDTTKSFYRLSIDELKKAIIAKEPGMQNVFKKYLEESPHLMKKVAIMPGKEVWAVTDLGQEMRAAGAWGLMMGVGNSGGWESAKTAVARILTQGAFSSEQRFQTGVFKKGASSSSDMASGGGDQVFTRLINSKTGKFDIDDFPLHGQAQILLDLDGIAQSVPYGTDSDRAGVKNRFSHDYGHYAHRSSLTSLAESIASVPNEVMVKNAIDPSHVVGVVVESEEEKQELITYLEQRQLITRDADGTAFVLVKDKKIPADDFIHTGNKFQKKWWGKGENPA